MASWFACASSARPEPLREIDGAIDGSAELAAPLERVVTVDEASMRSGVDPLATTPAIRRWARRTLRARSRSILEPEADAPRESVDPIETLRRALVARGWTPDDLLTHTAAEAFVERRGNCVSFALLLVAAARSQGLETGFLQADLDPRTRRSSLSIATGHVAVRSGAWRTGSARQPSHAHDTARALDADGNLPLNGFHAIDDRTARAIFWSNRGAESLLAGRFADGSAQLQRAVAVDPELAAAWANLGVALGRLDDAEGAEVAYRTAIDLEPDSLPAWRNLALLLERQRKLDSRSVALVE